MRTDLALEMRDRFPTLDGISEECEWISGLAVSRILVHSEQTARALDKPLGNYVTLTLAEGGLQDRDYCDATAVHIAAELAKLMPDGGGMALVVGLGNRYVTPDALGPRVSEHIFVTRHIVRHLPDVLPDGVRCVCACAPNVMGVTGIETLELVSGLVEQIRPDFVLAVDCLCSVETKNIGTAVQMNDSGISPGAGIGNHRRQLDKSTLGVPVIALGIPLVIAAETLIQEAMAALGDERAGKNHVEMPHPDVIVTPKDIDAMVRDASRLLSKAVNLALFGERADELEKLLR